VHGKGKRMSGIIGSESNLFNEQNAREREKKIRYNEQTRGSEMNQYRC
jgi:hypothetical protein